jgi:hypothetical protein
MYVIVVYDSRVGIAGCYFVMRRRDDALRNSSTSSTAFYIERRTPFIARTKVVRLCCGSDVCAEKACVFDVDVCSIDFQVLVMSFTQENVADLHSVGSVP